MKKLIVIILLFLCEYAFTQQITYNHIVDSTDAETKEVKKLFESYIASNPAKKEKSEYWNREEQERHEHFDFLEREFQPSLYMGFPIHVLSIKFEKDICKIKAQFSQCREDGNPYILAIVNYVVIKENGVFKLKNWLTHSRDKWNNRTVGLVDFYFPTYHEFDVSKAEKLNDFINMICDNLCVLPKRIEYYLADDYDEIQTLKGIDYYIGMGGQSRPSGKAADDKVYCGGLGEYYTHEVFHVQIDHHYPDKHFWVSEGIATYLGGSRGKPLQWHIKRINRYLQEHPEIDLTDLLTLTNLDSETAYHYVLGGLIAKKIMDKGGWIMLREFMSTGETDEDYYNAIHRFLGVYRSELNLYLRRELDAESKK